MTAKKDKDKLDKIRDRRVSSNKRGEGNIKSVKPSIKKEATVKFVGFNENVDMPQGVFVGDYNEKEILDSLEDKIVSIFNHVKKNIHTISYDWNDDSRAYELLTVIREGFDYRTFVSVAKQTPLEISDWSNILGSTSRTLERYKKDNKSFNSSQTEKIIEIQQLMHYGISVFGDESNFNKWLFTENIGLGGIVPKDLLDTTIGIGMVKDALGRIEHGIFA